MQKSCVTCSSKDFRKWPWLLVHSGGHVIPQTRLCCFGLEKPCSLPVVCHRHCCPLWSTGTHQCVLPTLSGPANSFLSLLGLEGGLSTRGSFTGEDLCGHTEPYTYKDGVLCLLSAATILKFSFKFIFS